MIVELFLTIFFLIFGGVLTLGIFTFWIWMIIDCAQRDFKNENDKIFWIILLIFTHLIGAIIYFFIVKNKKKKKKRKK